MAEEAKKEVEKKTETASAQPEEKEVEKTPQDASTEDIDYEAEFTAAIEELDKISKDKENYRKGMLVAKGKMKPEETDEPDKEDIEAIIDRKVNEKLLASREAQAQAKLVELNKKLLKDKKELALALKNKAALSGSTFSGKGGTETEVKEQYFTPEQLAYFQKRKLDPEKVKANYLKNKTRP